MGKFQTIAHFLQNFSWEICKLLTFSNLTSKREKEKQKTKNSQWLKFFNSPEFLTYKTYSFSLLFSSSTTSFSNYPLCWVISLWTNSWSPKIQEKKRWETTYMEITTKPQIKITPTTLLMMVKFNRKCNFITQSEMKMYNQDKRITTSALKNKN